MMVVEMEAKRSLNDIAPSTKLAPANENWLHRYAYRAQATPVSVSQQGKPLYLLEQVPMLMEMTALR